MLPLVANLHDCKRLSLRAPPHGMRTEHRIHTVQMMLARQRGTFRLAHQIHTLMVGEHRHGIRRREHRIHTLMEDGLQPGVQVHERQTLTTLPPRPLAAATLGVRQGRGAGGHRPGQTVHGRKRIRGVTKLGCVALMGV
jgi:hypothetical protein